MFVHISGFTRVATKLPRFLGRECFFNFSECLSEVSFYNHLLLKSLASFSETSWSVCSSAFRSFAIVWSKSSFDSRACRVTLLSFFKQRVAVWFRSVIIRVGVWVRQFINSWPFRVSLAIGKSSKGFLHRAHRLRYWEHMLSLSFTRVDSNESLGFAEATGIVLRTELFTSSSLRSVSSSSLSNSALNRALSGLKSSDECFPAILKDGIDSQSTWILDPGWICQVQV